MMSDDTYSADRLVEIAATFVESHAAGTLPPIVQLGHPVLRMRGLDYTGQLGDALLSDLLDTMRAVMHDAPGVGLAAPQLGLPLRLAVLEDIYATVSAVAETRERSAMEYFAAVNPSYSAAGTRTASFFEGCLSFDGYQAVVTRPADILGTYTTPQGVFVEREFSGWQARIFQHETDHLGGVVYIDKAETRSLCANSEYHRWADPGIERAAAVLGF
ncbi:peptide deformylase [Paeniglutamicibacter cryotolerans]|nr:peptide deformylase [Paeniglutamicibacter cryotolerans]